MHFQQLKKTNCKITLQTSAPRFSCNDHKGWVSVHAGVRFARHNCSHLRNVLYNNGDLHKWWSCSMRNCKSLCVTRLMRGRPITCENKTSQFTLQNTHRSTMKWALITMAIMTDQLVPEALVAFIKLHGSKNNCAHQSRAQNSLCSSNILLLYIYKTNLPNFHTYIKPIFLTKNPNLPNMLFILFHLYLCQLPHNVYTHTHTHTQGHIMYIHTQGYRKYIHTHIDRLYIHTCRDTDCTSTHTRIQTVHSHTHGYRLYIHTHTDTH